jgi:hypothetical protein
VSKTLPRRIGQDLNVGEFTVNLPLQHVALDELIDRAAWVPHVTIQSNVTTDADPAAVVEAVRAAIDGFGSVRASVGEEAHFGSDGSFLVNLVKAPALRAMHDVVYARLREDAGAVSINPAADGDGFSAHVTVTPRGRAREGDEIELDQVLVAEIGAVTEASPCPSRRSTFDR